MSLSRSFSPSAEPSALKWGRKHLEFQRGTHIFRRYIPFPPLLLLFTSSFFSFSFLSKIGFSGKMKQKFTHEKYMGVPPGSALRRGWRKQEWADEEANCNALSPEASLDFQRQFWSWKGPPVIPLWGEGQEFYPPHLVVGRWMKPTLGGVCVCLVASVVSNSLRLCGL